MRLLIIDNNLKPECWGSEDLCRMTRVVPGLTIQVRRAPSGDLPKTPQGFDAVVASGSLTSALDDSPWVGQFEEFIRKVMTQRIPYLGVCYGHQVLARATGGQVRKGFQSEYGWIKIRQTAPNPLFSGLKETFHSYASHQDEVHVLPPEFNSIASTERCTIQAMKHRTLPAFGIQFHPERSLEEAIRDLKKKSEQTPPLDLLQPLRSKELFDESVGKVIFRNFLSLLT